MTTPSQKPDLKQSTAAAVTGTLKGRVVSDDGRPLTKASVVAQATTNPGASKVSPVDSEGRFVFDEMPAAVYVVFATAPGYIDPSVATSEPSRWPRHLIGTQVKITMRITVRGADATGIELRLAPLSSIAGAITFAAIKTEGKCDKRKSQLSETSIEVRREGPKKSGSPALIGMYAGFGGTINNKGEFTIGNLEAGRYRLEINLPTESWYVRAINLTAATQHPRPKPSSGPPSEKYRALDACHPSIAEGCQV